MKTIILSLLIVIVLAAIGVVGHKYYFNEQAEDVTVTDTRIGQDIGISESDSHEHVKNCHKFFTGDQPIFPLVFPENEIDTSNWKTYQNEEFGFEIKYPANWKIEFDGMSSLSYPGQGGYLADFSVFPKEDTARRIDIFSMYAHSLEEYILSITNAEVGFPGYVKRFYILNNTIGVHALTQSSIPREVDFIERYTLEGTCNTVVLFDLRDESNEGRYRQELQKMLLSFKLIK